MSSRMVVDLRDRRPVWSIPDGALDELRASLPEGWTLHVPSTLTDGSGDGAGGPSDEVLRAVAGARAYVGFGIPPAILGAGGGSLEWVHSATAGVGGSLHGTMRRSPVRFTNSAGIHGPPMAETVVAMLLHFARGLDFAVAGMAAGGWDDAPFLAGDTPVRELAHMTVGVLGYGGIGAEVGRRLRGLGVRVLGLRRSPPERSADAYGVELVHGDGGLARLLGESDALVLTAPETPETRGILSRERIRSLRPGAVVINVARGGLVDEEALVEALADGHLRGAGLDVFREEPLPPEHPLWSLTNVLVTPHVSGVSRGFWPRQVGLIRENLGRFVSGRPLLNEVDRDAGY